MQTKSLNKQDTTEIVKQIFRSLSRNWTFTFGLSDQKLQVIKDILVTFT